MACYAALARHYHWFDLRRQLIEAALDYLVVARYAADPELQKTWRSFARACSHRLANLPPEAQAWITSADEYDEGRITADQLTAVRKADCFFSERFEQATLEERAALSAAKHRLWPELDSDPAGWHSTAWYFLHWCASAGVEEPTLVELLRQYFGPFLAAKGTSLHQFIPEAEHHAAADGGA